MNEFENQKHTKLPKRKTHLQYIRGLPFTIIHKKECIEEFLEYTPRDEDILIVGYPRTGTTWLSFIVHQILIEENNSPQFEDFYSKFIPYFPDFGLPDLETQTTKLRIVKHNIPYYMMKKIHKSKLIYIYRKPEDVFLSKYHLYRSINGSLNFDEYFEDYLIGVSEYGQYFKHFLSYLEYKDDENIYFVSYEKLKVRRREEILKLAQFLGEEYHLSLVSDESIVDRIMEQTSFDYMKRSFGEFSTLQSRSKEKVEFFFRGEIGRGSKTLTENQLKRLRNLAHKTMSQDIIEEWYGSDVEYLKVII